MGRKSKKTDAEKQWEQMDTEDSFVQEIIQKDKEAQPQIAYTNDFLDNEVMGALPLASREELKVVNTQAEFMEAARNYGGSIHPLTKRSHVVTVLMKLEEMALKGNVVAAKEFLDRTMGKVADVAFLGVSKYENMSDRELLDLVKGKKK